MTHLVPKLVCLSTPDGYGGSSGGRYEDVDITYKVLKQAVDLSGRRPGYGSLNDNRETGYSHGSTNSIQGPSIGGPPSYHRHRPPPVAGAITRSDPPSDPRLISSSNSSSSQNLPPHQRFQRTPSSSLSVNQGPPPSSSGNLKTSYTDYIFNLLNCTAQ